MKTLIAALLMLAAAFATQAQTIDIKGKSILIDGQPCLTVDKKDPNNISIADLQGNDLVYLKYADDKFGARYNTIIFVNTHSQFTSKQYIYTTKLLLKRLLENHVLENCKINDAKLENFIARFNENVQLN